MDGEKTVMVVEDDPTDRKLFRVLLQIEGYDVQAFGSAEEALAALAGLHPRLAIVDLHLPGLGGLELAAKLKADARTRSLPILAVSGSSGADAPARAARAGCDAFIPKPVDVKSFPASVARCIESGGSDVRAV